MRFRNSLATNPVKIFVNYVKNICVAELEEECCQSSDCVLEGVTFYVAYLGSCIVARPSGEDTTSQAVNTIVAMVSDSRGVDEPPQSNISQKS